MFYSLLKIIRRILKSIGKKEEYFIDLIKFYNFKNEVNKYDLSENFNPSKEISSKIKIFATIPFFYNEKNR